MNFANVNARELGCRVADVLLGLVDPLAVPVVMQPTQLVDFCQPKVTCARVPGDLAFLHVCPPQNPLVVRDMKHRQQCEWIASIVGPTNFDHNMPR